MAFFQIPGDTVWEKLKTWIAGADRSNESGSEYDGLLSYATEWHAAIIGLAAGLGLGIPGVAAVAATALGLGLSKKISTRKAIEELQKEPWYGMGASVIGYIIHHFTGISYADALSFLFDLAPLIL